MNVILIYPKTGLDFGATIAPPHSLLAIAAPLYHKGYSVKIIDQRVDPLWMDTLAVSLNSDTACVGISSMTGTQILFAIEAAKSVRAIAGEKVPIVWGGPHPSLLAEQTLASPYADIICVGEGDITFMELVEAIMAKRGLDSVAGIAFKDGNKVIRTPERALLDIETLLPTPWELVDVHKYIHPDFYLSNTMRSLDIGQTSRGCPFQCGFCCSAALRKRKWRPMSVAKSSALIIETVKKFNLDAIWIRDDEFYIDRQRAYEICKNMVNSGINIKWYTSGTRVDVFNKATDEEILMMKRSGADTLKFGAESGSNRILELMKKGIRWEDTLKANLKAKKFGIKPVFALMAGFPTETFEEINMTIDLMDKLKRDNHSVKFEAISSFTAFPGTQLYDLAVKMGLKVPEKLEDWSDWLLDEYDIEGRKLPWFNLGERISVGNISYMSILSYSSENAINAVSNNMARRLLKFIFKPIRAFERVMLRNKWYRFRPELKVVRFLRNKFFYKGYKVIH